MALTELDLLKLKAPFPLAAHEFINGYVYLAEESIGKRLDEVDPSWTFIPTSERREGNQAICTAVMTVMDVARGNTGQQALVIERRKGNKDQIERDIEIGEGDKGATTDAFKRCARMFGIGRYLLYYDVKKEPNFEAWLVDMQAGYEQTMKARGYVDSAPPEPPQAPVQPPAPVVQAQPQQQQQAASQGQPARMVERPEDPGSAAVNRAEYERFSASAGQPNGNAIGPYTDQSAAWAVVKRDSVGKFDNEFHLDGTIKKGLTEEWLTESMTVAQVTVALDKYSRVRSVRKAAFAQVEKLYRQPNTKARWETFTAHVDRLIAEGNMVENADALTTIAQVKLDLLRELA